MYPVEFEIKDTTENNTSISYLVLLLSIEREVNFTLPFMTNVTISISIISQTFRPWVAIFRLRQQTIAFSSHSLYDMPGLAPHMNVLF